MDADTLLKIGSLAVIAYVLALVRTPPTLRPSFWRSTAQGRRAPYVLAPQWAWKPWRSRLGGPQWPRY